jgi:uncharacterized protein YnzC (UPF0291/DUF896 family)
MELPDDVLALIRDYSRPRFKHFRIYNQVVKVLGKDMITLHVLKDKLNSESADKIIPVIISYMETLVQRKINQEYLNLYQHSHKLTEPRTPEWQRLMVMYIQSHRKEMKHYFELIGHMYGIKKT